MHMEDLESYYEELYFECVEDFKDLEGRYNKLRERLPSLVANLVADYLREEYGVEVSEVDIEDIVEYAIEELLKE